ncbi:mevalonate kinase [soil metagenome]
MSHFDLEITTHGKWILAGEHAVLRGSPAIIFPVTTRSLTLKYYASNEQVRAEFSGDFGDELQLLFWSALERAIENLGISHADILGRFHLENNIPVGTGMGASAALCVAIGRWFVWKNLIIQQELYEFARQLENLFHNESSGVDIAVALYGKGICFQRNGEIIPVNQQWQPHWYLSYSDKVATTASCVKKVKALWAQDAILGQRIDDDMRESVAIALHALQSNSEAGCFELAAAMRLASSCFERWGLTKGNVDAHIKQLRDAGAMAAKPTGSGGGGYVLSLWLNKPPENIGIELIAV